MISVIIPVYNAEKFIERALRSVMAQTYQDYEVVIINDGSTDRSMDIAYELIKDNGKFKVYSQDNAGVSAARNKGMDLAQGDWLFFLDADDYILPHALRTLSEHIESGADIIVGGVFRQTMDGRISKNTPPVEMDGKKVAIIHKTEIDWNVIKYMITNDVYFVSHCWGRLYRKYFLQFNKLRFLDTKIGEDGAFNILCLGSTYNPVGVIVIDEPIYCFQMHNNSSTIKVVKENLCDFEPLKRSLYYYFRYNHLDNINRFINNIPKKLNDFVDRSVQQSDTPNYKTLTRREVTISKLQQTNYPVVIYGADNVGKKIYEACKQYGIRMDGFCDYDKEKIGKNIYDTDVELPKLLTSYMVFDSLNIPDRFKNATFIISVMSIQNAVTNLKNQGIDNWVAGGLLLKHDLDFLGEVEACITAHNAYLKPDYLFLRSLDVMITEKCSLKCRDCSNLMQYFEHPVNYDVKVIKDDMDRMFELVDEILELRILGGDAFMHPKWYEIVEHAVKSNKVDRVVIYTNGVIVPKDLYYLCNRRVQVAITDYGTLSYSLDKLIYKLQDLEINYKVTKPDYWIDCASIEEHNRTDEENDKLFQNCVANNLTTLVDGGLFKCPYEAALNLLKITTGDYLSIYDIDKQLMKYFLNSNDTTFACDYCTSRILDNKIPPAVQIDKPLKYKKGKENG